jgi:NADH:quinone reductase (non-electrogenic)
VVIALGSITNFYSLPGFGELALAMKSLSDAIRLRAQIIRHLEEANSECNPIERRSLLTFVVAGGGFAGVETVAALNDFLREGSDSEIASDSACALVKLIRKNALP